MDNTSEYKKALEMYEKIDKKIQHTNSDEDYLETDTKPMHPYRFFQLSNISGFNKENGNTYEEYIKLFKNRKDI